MERELVDRLRAAVRLVVLLDYDGTLVPFNDVPNRASPDRPLVDLLRRVADRLGCSVHIVSGRPRETLERWFADLPLGLWAEHGLWHRRAPGHAWDLRAQPSREWMSEVRTILDRFTASTAGALTEEKTASLAWHYRMVEPTLAATRVAELGGTLVNRLRDQPAELLEGNRVLEIRPVNVHKGLIVRDVLAREPASALVLAIGDDRTDEDMFAALPATGAAVHVGPGASSASYRLPAPAAVRALLERLASTTTRGALTR